jgi:hypothetical protein
MFVLLFRHEVVSISPLCKEREGEAESVGYQSTTTGSTIEGSSGATTLCPYKGGGLWNDQPEYLPMGISEDPKFKRDYPFTNTVLLAS